MRLGSENNSIILLCNPADGLTTRNQGARKQFGIHNSQELTNLNVLRGHRRVRVISFQDSMTECETSRDWNILHV